jgi:YjbE family integral membrane protein
MFESILLEISTYHFWAALVGIILVDILLSGDNALVISAVTSKLPKGQQKAGVLIGASLAVGLRIALAFGAGWLLNLPFLAALGGLYLIKVAYDLVKYEDEHDSTHKEARSLWAAIVTIGLVDVSMSLDNVLAIASMAHGSTLLMALGVALSIPMVVGFSLLINAMLQRFPQLKWAGAVFLALIAGKVIAHDQFLQGKLPIDDAYFTYLLALASVTIVVVGGLVSRARGRNQAHYHTV